MISISVFLVILFVFFLDGILFIINPFSRQQKWWWGLFGRIMMMIWRWTSWTGWGRRRGWWGQTWIPFCIWWTSTFLTLHCHCSFAWSWWCRWLCYSNSNNFIINMTGTECLLRSTCIVHYFVSLYFRQKEPIPTFDCSIFLHWRGDLVVKNNVYYHVYVMALRYSAK